MLWWLIALSVVVLYLLIKLFQIMSWLKMYFDAVDKHFFDCCTCPGGTEWPPPKPPKFP